jgi:hypothetical protein
MLVEADKAGEVVEKLEQLLERVVGQRHAQRRVPPRMHHDRPARPLHPRDLRPPAQRRRRKSGADWRVNGAGRDRSEGEALGGSGCAVRRARRGCAVRRARLG